MPWLGLPVARLVLPPLRHRDTPQPRIHLPRSQHLDHQHTLAAVAAAQQSELRRAQREGLRHEGQKLLLCAVMAGIACEVNAYCICGDLGDGCVLLLVFDFHCDLAVAGLAHTDAGGQREPVTCRPSNRCRDSE